MKCKKRTPVVDAYRWEGKRELYPEWIVDAVEKDVLFFDAGTLFISTEFNGHIVCRGDYLIRHEDGRITRCYEHMFKQYYEIVEEDE